MHHDVLTAFGLRRATLADFGARNDGEEQPAALALVLAEATLFRKPCEPPSESLSDETRELRSQEPVERLVNTILMCALRDGAASIVVEAREGVVQVRFRLREGLIRKRGSEWEHIRLPALTLAPIAAQIKKLAAIERTPDHRSQSGSFILTVADLQVQFHVVLEPTAAGERIELRFDAPPHC